MNTVSNVFINLNELRRKKRIHWEGVLDWEKVEVDIGWCKVLKPVEVEFDIWVDGDTIILDGKVRTVIEHPCVRCLEPVNLEINGKMEAVYLPKSEMKKLPKEEELEEIVNIIYYSEGEIDLSERILEAIVVSVPQKVLCSEDCKGLCPICGANLNENPNHECKVEEKEVDPRFEALLELKGKLK
ncbi:MAG: DUF177 domain-containing protein [Thermotoga sp.]|nr:MAG: DUF177 domain-containing protein [Thermotoga sp.]